MEYLYYIANTSLTLRVVDYLRTAHHLPLQFITVIHQIDGWVVKVKMSQYLTPEMHGNFRAFMNELGIPYDPEIRLQMALWSLETGQSPLSVMRRYQVAVVCHGSPDRKEIEAFRQQFVKGLGYGRRNCLLWRSGLQHFHNFKSQISNLQSPISNLKSQIRSNF
jgi:hypothetical protein